MHKVITLYLFLTAIISTDAFAQSSIARRKQFLADTKEIIIKQRFRENTRRVSVQDSTWDDWLKRTGELPPDFDQMPSIPLLPDPLITTDSGKMKPIKTNEEWQRKREWIKAEYQQWISGHMPPAPKDVRADILSDKVEEGTRIQTIELHFGPQNRAKMTIELIIPTSKKPAPVFLTQWNHRDWAQLAVKRGYIACVYAAADIKDDTDPYQSLYPDYDFSSLMRRAWGASRVVDYLLKREEVNDEQIAITGHSRNGKQSLWAAAFDERIAAVVSSSSSTGGDAPWRYGDPQYASETLDYVTAWNGHWFHPRLRFFFGREDRLPVDQNALGALIAPRPLLYHYSIVERGLNSWANEQNYYAVKQVYDFLQKPENIGVLTRMGEHPVAARDVERTLDFLDIHFNRLDDKWINHLYYTYSFDEWEAYHPNDKAIAATLPSVTLKKDYTDTLSFHKDRTAIIEKLNWLLGDEPTGLKAVNVGAWDNPRQDWIEKINPRPKVKGAKAIYLGPYTAIGDHIGGVLYCPVDTSDQLKTRTNGKLPVIIYAHQYAHSTGFSKGYDKDGRAGTAELFQELTKMGFAVLAIDMFGFGTRIEEAKNFYKRHPTWSKMGKMIRDLRGCIDAVEQLDYLDNEHIYLLGNTIGGSVSLMTAALDDRVAGLATVAAFSPWRTSNDQYESIRIYAHLHGFIPRLGFFVDSPRNTPIDFGEIIAAAAPKPMKIIAPELDRHTDIPALQDMISAVSGVYELYGKRKELVLTYPREINRMTVEMYQELADFFDGLYQDGNQKGH
ncbi:alpha/beta fold hydrolase [Olivibacter sp. SDN3]|uniref:alpha/beta fold hydrolase n=1 Tax=Olivibacter sp. SDN3 TaxID=2764720 RepID=UPI002107A7D9|nr:alpha/beta fold hydrolase [Olivibacter sp. SDN3]